MKKTDIESGLLKYMEGKSSPVEKALVKKWLSANIAKPEYDAVFEKLLDETRTEENEAVTKRAFDRIQASIRDRKRNRTVRILAAANAVLAAAAIALFVVVFRPGDAAEWREIYVAKAEKQELALPDGSKIWINSDTKVIYPERFGKDCRKIYVDGEIYADIAKDRKKPFVVSASGVEVEVLGTQFDLKAFAEDRNVDVTLIEGSVALKGTGEGREFSRIMTPGEMLRYDKTTDTVREFAVDTLEYSSWRTGNILKFMDCTLEEIAADLERRFDVRIVIEDKTIARTRYYASFINDEDIDTILATMNGSGIMDIVRKDNIIIISSRTGH